MMMSFKELVMRWRYRLDQARAMFSLVTFAAILAVTYVKYIPFLDKMGLRGVVLLTLMAMVGFMIGGYVYDKIGRFWKEHIVVVINRNPYTFVPVPKEFNINRGMNVFMISVLQKIAEKNDIDCSKEISLASELVEEYYSLTPETANFEEEAKRVKLISDELMKTLRVEDSEIK